MRSERGFTLIELLVVIAILAVLFGATALALAGVGDNAEAASATGELAVVQTALDVCDALSTCTNGSSTVCKQVGPSTSGFGNYLRRSSNFRYSWNSNGTIITQTSQAADGTCSSTASEIFYP